MTERISDAELEHLELAVTEGLTWVRADRLGRLVAELRLLRAELAARPEPIGYALSVPGQWGAVLAPHGYRTSGDAIAARAEIQPDMAWQVCALIPVDAPPPASS